ncbi:hypothetical protein MUG84_08585 [Paenibacillus sp. KQZ6P-2]|uniref:Uncharacterized protein n=1 Tax=Paenibacillus mangrovi TaxID=2931978 RepID=A0A9X1WM25_9BACL|nr:hypothetical protein [Paenibacillus mangrovi]MCJ8011797.1 hypothetical protein [Paenibacillus mangrovi]
MDAHATYLNKIATADPLADLIQDFTSRQPHVSVKSITIDKGHYLDFAEGRVRAFLPYINDQGAVLDPSDGKEHEYATASFAKAGAVLIQAGRCQDLQEIILKAMDWASYCLGEIQVPDDHADFTSHMLVLAYEQLSSFADPSRVDRWRSNLQRVEPELTYSQTERNFPDIRQIRNWATYAMHGEMMRLRAGLTDSTAFIDKYLPYQLTRFTPEGLYRDPNLPAAYDLAARDQLSGILEAGYEGAAAVLLKVLLHRGAKTMLFTQSVTGSSSCGGRSNQLLWNELSFVHICEREAAYCLRYGDLFWAGTFKRAAHLAYQSILRWVEDPAGFRLFKNRFPIAERVGYEFYAYHSTYSLYAAQIAVSCYLDADDSIEETASPADVGGFVLHLPSFHRIYATTGLKQGGYHVNIDTAAQMGQDATGFVRLHRAGIPEETALSTGIAGLEGEIPWIFYRPKQTIPAPLFPAAIGPMWRDEHGAWHRLANYGRRQHEVFHALDAEGQPLNAEQLHWLCELSVPAPEDQENNLSFTVTYAANPQPKAYPLDPNTPGANVNEVYRRAVSDVLPRPGNGSAERIEENYRIGMDEITVTWKFDEAEAAELTAVGVTVPLLVTNGTDQSSILCEGNKVTVKYGNATYTVWADEAENNIEMELLPGRMPNRNGHYRIAQWTRKDKLEVSLHFSLTTEQ